MGVSFDYGISLHFVLLLAPQNFWATFQAKSNARRAPASTALTLLSHQSHKVCTTNRHLRGSGERNGEQRKALVKPHWSCCGWQKGTSRDEAASNSAKIKPIALVVIELRLSEGISHADSQSVSRKIC